MKSTTKTNRTRKPHSNETREKIAKSNTGKVFSEERRRNIGLSKTIILSDDKMKRLHEMWEKLYYPPRFIMNELELSERVYLRLLKEHCSVGQVKFLPQDLHPDVFQSIIQQAQDGVPYKDIAETLGLKSKQVRLIITKLSFHYGISPTARTYVVSEEHKLALKNRLSQYNTLNPKKKEMNPNWGGGVTPLHEAIRALPKYRQWRMMVLRRDKSKCVFCSSKIQLHVDHIYPFCMLVHDGKITSTTEAENYPPLWDVSNGRVLCVVCHRKTETYAKQRKKYESATIH